MDKIRYGYRFDNTIWLDSQWAIERLVETYHCELMDMSEEDLVQEYVNKFGDPNRS